MFDYHMHTVVSFDGHCRGIEMARAAADAGLKEICFTDHLDYDPMGKMGVLWPSIRNAITPNMTTWRCPACRSAAVWNSA